MKIINNENIFTDDQIEKTIKLLGKNYKFKTLIICETRIDYLLKIKYCLLTLLSFISIMLGRIEGMYTTFDKKVIVFVFSENDDGENIHSKQLYSLHALCHELRHLYQIKTGIGINEADADRFATNFINNNSKSISKIMNWKNEWEIEEV